MAKIEFSANELELLKKAAEEGRAGGEEKARTILRDAGFELEISPAAKAELVATENGGGCYACITCLVLAALISVGWV